MLLKGTINVVNRDVWMLLLCGKENFGRRRQLTPYTFFNYIAAMLA
jgi:hypothetical protein